MPSKIKQPMISRSKGWTAYERHYGRTTTETPTVVIKADGEISPIGYGNERPATQAEIEEELARREERKQLLARIDAFRARPEWRWADDIRNAIECMDHDRHPLDRLTPEEWKTLRDRICG